MLRWSRPRLQLAFPRLGDDISELAEPRRTKPLQPVKFLPSGWAACCGCPSARWKRCSTLPVKPQMSVVPHHPTAPEMARAKAEPPKVNRRGKASVQKLHYGSRNMCISQRAPHGNADRQLDLFGRSTAALRTIIASHPCKRGCDTAAVGSSCAMHAGRLNCTACGAFLGWASHALVAQIRGFVTGTSSFEPGSRP
jgi:hypothetical protein